jgi:hypothetical protein
MLNEDRRANCSVSLIISRSQAFATTPGVPRPRPCALIIRLSTRHMRFAISKNNQMPSTMLTSQ